MTVTYSEGLGVLKKWDGSVWRAVWKDLVIWLCLYYSIRLLLDTIPMNEDQRKVAINVVAAFEEFIDHIPVSFLLGFYVVQIVNRWWAQVNNTPWPDELILMTNAAFLKKEERHIRQSVARWIVLCQAMVFRKISKRIRRRFPTLESLIEAGLLASHELEMLRNLKCKNNRWQVPLHWMTSKVVMPSDLPPPTKNAMIAAINKFGDSQRRLFVHDWIGIPLVYTQTCTVVVYGYFLFCAIGHQPIGKPVDLYIPFLTILQLIFYVGWLKVGRDLMRPFGEDSDDIELNYLLDRNAAVSMNLVDQVAEEAPDLIEDPQKQQAFVDKMMGNLAYSKAALEKQHDRFPKMHSVVKLKDDQYQMLLRPSAGAMQNTTHQPTTNRSRRKSHKPPNLF